MESIRKLSAIIPLARIQNSPTNNKLDDFSYYQPRTGISKFIAPGALSSVADTKTKNMTAIIPKFVSAIPLPANNNIGLNNIVNNLSQPLSELNRKNNLYEDKNINQNIKGKVEILKSGNQIIESFSRGQHIEDTLLRYMLKIRQEIHDEKKTFNNIDNTLANIIDEVVSRTVQNNLTELDIAGFYQEIEKLVIPIEDRAGFDGLDHEVSDDIQSLQDKIKKFILICIALGKHFSTYSPFGALFLTMFDKNYKRIISEKFEDDAKTDVDSIEFDAWEIITSKILPQDMLKYKFFPRELFEKYRNLVSEQTNLRHQNKYPDKVKQKFLYVDAEFGLQEVKLIQAIHQQKLKKYKKAITLIWLSGGKDAVNIPLNYLENLKQNLIEFKRHRYNVKIIMLIDYRFFNNNSGYFKDIVQNYSSILEIEFIEHLNFQDDSMQKLHKIFLKKAFNNGVESVIEFYSVAINFEQKLSSDLQYNIFIPFEYLQSLAYENFWDKLKRNIPFVAHQHSKLIGSLNKIFREHKGISQLGIRFFNIERLNIKSFIKNFQHLL